MINRMRVFRISVRLDRYFAQNGNFLCPLLDFLAPYYAPPHHTLSRPSLFFHPLPTQSQPKSAPIFKKKFKSQNHLWAQAVCKIWDRFVHPFTVMMTHDDTYRQRLQLYITFIIPCTSIHNDGCK